MALVIAPDSNFTGTVAGVTFVDGTGDTSDTWALAYFTRAGYRIEEGTPPDLSWSDTEDLESATVDTLRRYAAAHSIDLTGLTRKADIIDRISVPGAPAKPTGTPGDTEVEVAWSAPTYTGLSAITGYVVRAYDEDGGLVGDPIEAEASPETVTGLENDEDYTFTVAAVNDAGEGPESPPSDAVTPTSGG